MATKLLCRVGRHKWKHQVNDEGTPYKECARCGKCAQQQGGGGSKEGWIIGVGNIN
jgi:hypothetical protein